jgi:predicted dehydrogenase
MPQRKLRGGMVGGGPGAFIGPVHRVAAELDGEAEILAGAFSRDPERSRRTASQLFLDPSRVYADYLEMAGKESRMPPDRRLDFVVIATPNATHAAVAAAFLQHGFHVVCEKPLAVSLDQAKALERDVRGADRLLMLAHAYTGYPMVKQARHVVATGELGTVHKVIVEYHQGALVYRLHNPNAPQKAWKSDPAQVGRSLAMADIGIHAENLARYVTGLEIEELCAETASVMVGQGLEDDGSVLVRYRGGARGLFSVSQVCTGEQNGLSLRVYGDRSSLAWRHETPDLLLVRDRERFDTVLHKGGPSLCEEAIAAGRLPLGHPDGMATAFANLYRQFYAAIRAREDDPRSTRTFDFPTVHDGVLGMAFIETVLESAQSSAKWIAMAR